MKELLNHIDWVGEIPSGIWKYLPDIGCTAFLDWKYAGDNSVDPEAWQLVVYRAADEGNTEDLDVVADWDELPLWKRNFIDNAKGIGRTTGNTARSVAIFADGKDGQRNGVVAAYLSPLIIPRVDLLDVRDPDSWLGEKRTLARSTARYVGSKVLGERRVVEHINRTYLNPQHEPYDVVEMSPAPFRMREEIARRGQFKKSPYWLLWRNPEHTLKFLGTVTQGNLC